MERSLNAASGPVSGSGESSAGGVEVEIFLVAEVQRYLESLRRRRDPDPDQRAAWEQFFRVYAPLIRRLVRTHRPPADELDDCVQEVWSRLIVGLGRFRCDAERGCFRSWLRTLVRHAWADRRRCRSCARLDPGMALLIPGREPDPAAEFERNRVAGVIRHALDDLRPRVSARSYRVLYLRWIEGRSVPEIAAELDLSPAQVRLRHHRTLAVLGKLISRPAAGEGWRMESPAECCDP